MDRYALNFSLTSMKICSVNGCERKVTALGYCSAHYERVKKGSGLKPDNPLRKSLHSITDEQLKEAAQQTKSWRQLLLYLGFSVMSGARKDIQNRVKGLNIDTSHFPIQKPRTKCLVDMCSEMSHAKGYCSQHYGYFKRNGNPLLQIRENKKRYNVDGYVMLDKKGHPFVTAKSGRIMEHRLVMSDHLKRALLQNEQVHHKNSQRQDNRLENLELWSTNQPIGGRVNDLISWAKEIISLYGDDETKY